MWLTKLSTFTRRAPNRCQYSRRATEHSVYVFGPDLGEHNHRKGNLQPRLVEPWEGLPIASLHASWQQTFIVTADHHVFAWGNNDLGQLGTVHVKKSDITWPHKVQALSPVKVMWIEAGRAHTVVLTDEGRVLTFGIQEFGQLGNGIIEENSISELPAIVDSLRKYKVKKMWNYLTLAESGEVFAWGFNREYQLGLNIEEDIGTPTRVRGLEKKITKISAGFDYNLALTKDGDFYGWGSGESWQLGNGERDIKRQPVLVSIPGEKVTELTTAGTSVIAMTGNIYSWGLGMAGRLGHGTEEDATLPKKMEFWDQVNSKVVKIAGRGGHHLALTDKGELYSWGYGGHGRLGHGDENDQCLPKKIEFFADKKIVAFTTGLDHSVVAVEE